MRRETRLWLASVCFGLHILICSKHVRVRLTHLLLGIETHLAEVLTAHRWLLGRPTKRFLLCQRTLLALPRCILLSKNIHRLLSAHLGLLGVPLWHLRWLPAHRRLLAAHLWLLSDVYTDTIKRARITLLAAHSLLLSLLQHILQLLRVTETTHREADLRLLAEKRLQITHSRLLTMTHLIEALTS